jgi:restriction system protein
MNMSSLSAVEEVLKIAGVPLHYREITRQILEKKLWITEGKTPEATINARLATDIKNKGVQSKFYRAGKGVFGLTEWEAKKESETSPDNQEKAKLQPTEPTHVKITPEKPLSFTDAAEKVLTEFGSKRPMYYRDITAKALELGWLLTEGKTPEATMYAQILMEIKRYQKRGEQPRFVMHGKGFVGLSRWMGRGLVFEIEQHNRRERQALHKRLLAMEPSEFEELTSRLLAEMGFEDIEVTKRSADGGIDVRGTLVVGDVIRTKMAVQVKKWKPTNRVQAPVVQQVRGSLGAHEQGLIITTSDFSQGARKEAARPDATPVALMNGEQLVALLVEHNIGVTRRSHYLIEMGEEETSSQD